MVETSVGDRAVEVEATNKNHRKSYKYLQLVSIGDMFFLFDQGEMLLGVHECLNLCANKFFLNRLRFGHSLAFFLGV